MSNSEDPEPEKSEPAGKVTQVEVVSSVGGLVTGPMSELEYLEKMSKLHFEWHLHYQKTYQDLVKQGERSIEEK